MQNEPKNQDPKTFTLPIEPALESLKLTPVGRRTTPLGLRGLAIGLLINITAALQTLNFFLWPSLFNWLDAKSLMVVKDKITNLVNR